MMMMPEGIVNAYCFNFLKIVHQICSICDLLKQEEVVVDDSRTFGKPFELLIGRSFKLECWEDCIKSMFHGEISRFSCPLKCVGDYPTISRSLRDLYSGNKTD